MDVLLYSTLRNSAQSYVAVWMRGVWGRMDTCICMAESLGSPPATVTTLLTGYIHQYKIKMSLKKKSLEKKKRSTQWALHETKYPLPPWKHPGNSPFLKALLYIEWTAPMPHATVGLDSSVTANQTPWRKTLHHPCLRLTLYLEWTLPLIAVVA